MKIVNKLTLRHLKENKGRTIITTLGIIVSVIMITVVLVGSFSFLNLYSNTILTLGGDYHFFVAGNSDKTTNVLNNNSNVDTIGIEERFSNLERGYFIESGTSKYNSTGFWYAGDENQLNMMITSKYDGRLPKNNTEIMVEEELISKNDFDWKIGDTVEIQTGRRYKEFDTGVSFNVMGSGYRFGEQFDMKSTDKYKIVGILHNNLPTKNSGAGIVRGNSSDVQQFHAYVKLKNITPATSNDIFSIFDALNISRKDYIKDGSAGINTGYLETKFCFINGNSTILKLIPVCVLILLVIMIASVVLIYNAFGMSYAEKVRYLGMLSSVGATRKQKRDSVYFEGLVLGAVGISAGFLLGIGFVSIILKVLGGKIIEAGLIAGAHGMTVKTVVPFYAVLLILVLSCLTVFVSVVKPARKASSITPIDAIRQNSEIKKAKKIRTSGIVRFIFGYEGELASKNLKRNGRKSRIITVSIALSVIMFLSCNYFCDLFVQYSGIKYEKPFQVEASIDVLEHAEFENFLKETEGVERFYSTDYEFFNTDWNNSVDEDDELYSLIIYDQLTPDVFTDKFKNVLEGNLTFSFHALTDADFDSLCKDNGIDPQPYYELGENDAKKCVVMNNIAHEKDALEFFTENVIGKQIREDYFWADGTLEGMGNRYQFGEFVKYDENNYACRLDAPNSVSLYLPRSMYECFWSTENDSWGRSYGIETDSHAQVTEAISDYFENNDLDGSWVDDEYLITNQKRTIVFAVQVAVYGFIALMTLITLFNIINTISTGIALRRKEFAMLKSVGTTPKGIKKMIMLESAFYGIKALIFALPISALVCLIINKTLGERTIPFEINWLMYILVSLAVFLIIGITMIYSVYKLRHDNIIATLKEDIS